MWRLLFDVQIRANLLSGLENTRLFKAGHWGVMSPKQRKREYLGICAISFLCRNAFSSFTNNIILNLLVKGGLLEMRVLVFWSPVSSACGFCLVLEIFFVLLNHLHNEMDGAFILFFKSALFSDSSGWEASGEACSFGTNWLWSCSFGVTVRKCSLQ